MKYMIVAIIFKTIFDCSLELMAPCVKCGYFISIGHCVHMTEKSRPVPAWNFPIKVVA